MTKAPIYFLIFIVVFNLSLLSQNTVPQNLNISEKIGWIPFDRDKDNPDFHVCDELNIEEYYQVNPSYNEGMYSIRKYFQVYQHALDSLCEKDGYIIVRFVINCEGQSDRYRVKFISLNYSEEIGINDKLKIKLIDLIRQMGKWTPGQYNGKKYDCYQHLKFLFKEGKLIDILY